MKISLKIFLGYFLLVGLSAWFVLTIFVDEVKPGVRQAMEDTLVDTANVLAELAANDVKNGNITNGNFAQSLASYQARANYPNKSLANINGVKKQSADYRVYITDTRGIVIFDSAHLALGQDYSQWNDVYLTLRGKYGVRSSPIVAGVEKSDSIMYIAAPIKDANQIIGSLTVAKSNRTVLPFIERAQTKIIRWGALLLVLSLIIGSLFTWRFTSKINQLRDYAFLVAKGEKATPPTSSNDELTELANAMQTMRSELDGKQYVQDYIHQLTHELKSPITAIQASSELLQTDMPPADQHKFIGNIQTQSQRLQQMIQNMLGLSAMESQQALPQTSLVDLAVLTQQQIEHLQPKASRRGILLVLKPLSIHASIQVLAEPFLLGQAINNLLENALDFSPPYSQILVEIVTQETIVTLSIKDNGTGIPDFALDKIFDKFYSLPRPATQQKSTGLGLNFVQEVAKLHGGSVTLSNQQDGGALAILILPYNYKP